jgi:ribosomal protein L37AE/L43A
MENISPENAERFGWSRYVTCPHCGVPTLKRMVDGKYECKNCGKYFIVSTMVLYKARKTD